MTPRERLRLSLEKGETRDPIPPQSSMSSRLLYASSPGSIMRRKRSAEGRK